MSILKIIRQIGNIVRHRVVVFLLLAIMVGSGCSDGPPPVLVPIAIDAYGNSMIGNREYNLLILVETGAGPDASVDVGWGNDALELGFYSAIAGKEINVEVSLVRDRIIWIEPEGGCQQSSLSDGDIDHVLENVEEMLRTGEGSLVGVVAAVFEGSRWNRCGRLSSEK